MDTFDLKWPKTQATFYTDGWRCRIVWRAQGGPGGSIDNNDLCKRRLADSLSGAPYLLPALRARGYGNLASEIESLVEQEVDTEAPGRAGNSTHRFGRLVLLRRRRVRRFVDRRTLTECRRGSPHCRAMPPSPKPPTGAPESGSKRVLRWLRHLYLKSPAAKGKQEWVLKRTWPDGDAKQANRKPEYVAAPYLRGVLSYLAGRGADASVFESLLAPAKV